MGLNYSLIEKSVLRKPGSPADINQVLNDAKVWMEELQAATSLTNYFYYANVTDGDTKYEYNVYPDEAVAYFNLTSNIIEIDVGGSSGEANTSISNNLTNSSVKYEKYTLGGSSLFTVTLNELLQINNTTSVIPTYSSTSVLLKAGKLYDLSLLIRLDITDSQSEELSLTLYDVTNEELVDGGKLAIVTSDRAGANTLSYINHSIIPDTDMEIAIKVTWLGSNPVEILQGGSYFSVKETTFSNALMTQTLGLKYATAKFVNLYPAAGEFAPFLQQFSNNTIPIENKIDDYTFLLEAGKTYKFDGGVEVFTTKSGVIIFNLKVYSDQLGTNEIETVADGYSYENGGSTTTFRGFRTNGYYTPSENCYLKVLCETNNLSDPTALQYELTISEYSVNDVKTTTSHYSSEETLTNERWSDGKPIYTKVIDAVMPADGTTEDYLISDDCEYVVNIEPMVEVNSDNKYYGDQAGVSGTSTRDYSITVYLDKNIRILNVNNNVVQGSTVKIIVKYTKTSDTSDTNIISEYSGQYFLDGINYSDQEVLTDKRWINGKPIYNRVLTGLMPPDSTGIPIELNIGNNIENCIIVRQSVHRADDWNTSGDAYDACRIDIRGDGTYLWTQTNHSGYYNRPYTVIIEYTKTTDTHLSPISKVVGNIKPNTDIDTSEYIENYTRGGKTVYGIEVDCGALPNAATKEVTIPGYNSSYTYWVCDQSYSTEPNAYSLSLPFSHPAGALYTIACYVNHSLGSIRLVTGSDRSSYTETKVVLNYTK